jgi:hypothetical protein
MIDSKENSFLKSKVDDRILRIANVLLLNASFTDNIGLLNGKMGIAIFFYNYARYTGSKIFEEYAGELIDEIYEEINTNTPADFTNGLTGIGWGIEYLVKNGFIEADTDEALSDIDNSVYRSMFSRPLLLENGNELFGYGFYYIARLGAGGVDDENLSAQIKKQHLVYLYNYTIRLFVKNEFHDFNIESLSIDTINSITWFLLEIYRLGLFPEEVEKLFHCLSEKIKSCLQNFDDKAGQSQLLLLTEKILISITDIDLQKVYNTILKKKNGFRYDSDVPDNVMVDSYVKETWQKLLFAPYLSEDKTNQEDAEKLFLIIDNEEYWNRQLDNLDKNNMGLAGFAGLGLGILSLTELLKNH